MHPDPKAPESVRGRLFQSNHPPPFLNDKSHTNFSVVTRSVKIELPADSALDMVGPMVKSFPYCNPMEVSIGRLNLSFHAAGPN